MLLLVILLSCNCLFIFPTSIFFYVPVCTVLYTVFHQLLFWHVVPGLSKLDSNTNLVFVLIRRHNHLSGTFPMFQRIHMTQIAIRQVVIKLCESIQKGFRRQTRKEYRHGLVARLGDDILSLTAGCLQMLFGYLTNVSHGIL